MLEDHKNLFDNFSEPIRETNSTNDCNHDNMEVKNSIRENSLTLIVENALELDPSADIPVLTIED